MNIFVAKLNFKTTSEMLQEIFSQYGQVTSAKVIMDRATGRSKGFGFVEMPNDDEARAAIAQLNNAELQQSTIVVKEAEPHTPRQNTGGGFRPRGDSRGGGRGGFGGGGGGGRRRPPGDFQSGGNRERDDWS